MSVKETEKEKIERRARVDAKIQLITQLEAIIKKLRDEAVAEM